MYRDCPKGTFPYIIQSGDTFHSLANRYNTTDVAIAGANPGIDPNNLPIGQVICMPAIAPPAPCPCGSRIYLVQAGDSFYSIAEKFNVPFGVLYSANPGLDAANLQIGQAVCLPPLPPCPVNSIAYAVRPGNTYYSLAKIVGLPVDELIRANPPVSTQIIFGSGK